MTRKTRPHGRKPRQKAKLPPRPPQAPARPGRLQAVSTFVQAANFATNLLKMIADW